MPEAWIAVDEKSCLVVSVPKISGRYYTVQFRRTYFPPPLAKL